MNNGECSPGDKLRARIARMDPKKVEAYVKFRTPSRDNVMTKFYFENRLFRRGVPFLVSPPRARDFRYPPHDSSDVLDLKHGKLKWEEDGFDLVATVESDDTQADLDYLGELYEREDRAPAGAIPMEKREVYTGDWQPKYWFVPQLDVDGERKAHRGDSTRHEAWLRAQHTLRWDYNRLREFGQYWWTVGVVVKVYKNGVKLGESSTWGIESDSHEYHLEAAKDEAHEALKEAKETLKKLQIGEAEKEGKILKTYVVEEFERQFLNFHFFQYERAYVTRVDQRDAVITFGFYQRPIEEYRVEKTRFSVDEWDEIIAHVTKEKPQ